MKTVRRKRGKRRPSKWREERKIKREKELTFWLEQWNKFKGERRESEKEGKWKFWRDGEKAGAELWKKGVEEARKREIVRERERESGIRESLNSRKENVEKRRERGRERSEDREGKCKRLLEGHTR